MFQNHQRKFKRTSELRTEEAGDQVWNPWNWDRSKWNQRDVKLFGGVFTGYPVSLLARGRKSYFRKAVCAVRCGFVGIWRTCSVASYKTLANHRVSILQALNSFCFPWYPLGIRRVCFVAQKSRFWEKKCSHKERFLEKTCPHLTIRTASCKENRNLKKPIPMKQPNPTYIRVHNTSDRQGLLQTPIAQQAKSSSPALSRVISGT